MVELENTEVPKMSHLLKYRYRYADDTIAFFKDAHTETIMSVLTNHHTDIKFIHEAEEDGVISFFDVHHFHARKPNNKLLLKVKNR